LVAAGAADGALVASGGAPDGATTVCARRGVTERKKRKKQAQAGTIAGQEDQGEFLWLMPGSKYFFWLPFAKFIVGGRADSVRWGRQEGFRPFRE
jgi:hypothetical protein